MKRLLAIKKRKRHIAVWLFLFLVPLASLNLYAHVAESQILKNTTVTVQFKGGSLDAAISELQKASRVAFAYDRQLLSLYQVEGFVVRKENLEKVVQKLLQHKPLSYAEVNKVIVISKKRDDLIYHTAAVTNNNEIMITGAITDENKQPFSGVNVTVKGTLTMTSTDAKGRYKILVESPQAVLVFSYVGYVTAEVAAGNSTTLDLQMKPGVGKDLAEIAVVGFGSKQKKISLVGAQSTVNVEELHQPVANVSTMLAGRVSGIVGVQRSGEPGKSSADIWIRGIATSFGNSSSPLILVDGVERDINTIDPEDIESFTILKDASSTAVYGVRGANGVIFIKTKVGKVGKPQIYFDYSEGLNTFTKKPQMLDGINYMNLVNEALTTRNQAPMYTKEYIDKTASGLDPLVYPDVNWMDAVFNQTGHTRKANLNVSGGVDNAQYYVSLAYFGESSFLKTDDMAQYNSKLHYDRYNVTTKLNMKLTNTTKAEVGVMGYFSTRNAPYEDPSTIFASAMAATPVMYPIMYPGGIVPGITSNGASINPYAQLTRNGYRTENQNQLYSNLRLTQDLGVITKGLSATAMVAFDANSSLTIKRLKRDDTYTVDKNDPHKADGSLNLQRTWTSTQPYLGFDKSNGGNRQTYVEGAINYQRDFNLHRVSSMILGYASSKTDAFAGDITSSIPSRLMGLAGRVTYSYDDRYFVEFNGGYNGSELFAPNNRFGFFPAIGAGWLVSNEKFFNPLLNAISFLKFRYSYGKSGLGLITSGSRRFAYITEVSDGATGYDFGRSTTNNAGGIVVTDYAVPVMTWSTSLKQDLGFEAKFMRNKLSLIVDLFSEKRTGIFMQRQSAVAFNGLQKQLWGNLGAVDNRGIDATLEYNTRIGEVGLNIRGNFTYSKNKVVENDMPPQAYPWLEHRGDNALARYGYIAEGLFADQGEIDKSAVPGDKSKVLPGDIKYKDLNGDGVIDANDVAKIGHGDVPSMVFGFGFNVTWKNFQAGVLFQGIDNADRMLQGRAIMPFNASDASNAYAIALNRWTVDKPNQDVFYPRLAYGEDRNFNNTRASSWWVKDVSFLRLKTAMLSYNLPAAILRGWGIKNSAIYMQGINLLTFSKFKLWDPELNTDNGISYPNVRTISLGVNLKF
ncbi:SusC/RagA family TonB-linked outer membrane protein [Niastella koreensis]|uniref:TonB-dependent receptor plug n=2 Tax=Niastella koreensis TaxID=354356 RepID=G8TGW7_NIAKG|nr:TonB-dependent receptor [Niastella koreensis]AEV99569.1 TonB-dependent receptor plug [Niastella koreensis GR20-10]OQP50159.1 SusC/RagA family TonB-linked outer membrane protein [Niastella koreensis]